MKARSRRLQASECHYRAYQRAHLSGAVARQRARYATDPAYRTRRLARNRARRRAQAEGVRQEASS